MNQNMQIWLEALKSGQYEQATGNLEVVEDGKHFFCCLGVACDIAVKSGVDMEVAFRELDESIAYDGEGGILPEKVAAWLEADKHPHIRIDNPHYDHTMGWSDEYFKEVDRHQDQNPRYLVDEYVTDLNDTARMTFEQIAQLVEYAGGFHQEV